MSKTNWHALWQEERAEVKRLTEALIALKGTPGVYAGQPKAAEPLAPKGLPKPVEQNLGKLMAQIKAARPDLPESEIEAEARRIAASFVADT